MNAKYIGFDIDSKKNDRIDARKQAVLLGIGEVPPVHIPGGGAARRRRSWPSRTDRRRPEPA